MTALETGGKLLKEAQKTLPAQYYYDAAHYQRELEAIWYKNWIYVCRAEALEAPRSFRTMEVGNQSVIILKDDDGEFRAFHNVCRHRGSRLITEESGTLKTKFITCPYHSWCYKQNGELKATTSKNEPENFNPESHALCTVALSNWNGFIFINMAGDNAAKITDCIENSSADLSNWNITNLRVGHTLKKELNCNWKIFWENFNECLHCPGVHKSLVQMVPIYQRGLMDPTEDENWPNNLNSDNPKFAGGMRKGAQTWTTNGQPIGPTFANLTEDEIKTAYNYLVILPTIFIVCHVDYVRIVRLTPLGPEKTEVYVEWLFAPETLDDPKTDITPAIDFATAVIMEDAYVSELNQQGIRSIAYKQGTLMPEEYCVYDFNKWVLQQLNVINS